METHLLETSNIQKIAAVLKSGEVIAMPTETVFGLATLIDCHDGLEQIYRIKKRSLSKAITLMVASVEQCSTYAYIDERAFTLMNELMPGKLTIVLPKKDVGNNLFTAGLDTIGIRIPDDSFVLELLRTVGPMWVTSANLSGQDDIVCVKDVITLFKGQVAAIVNQDAGNDKPSTVVQVTDGQVDILRQGSISEEKILEVYYEDSISK